MKAFFEEYGLVLVVTVIVVGMLTVADTFQGKLSGIVDQKWSEVSNTSAKDK